MIRSKKCKIKGCEKERYANIGWCLEHYKEHELEKRLKKEERAKNKEEKIAVIKAQKDLKKIVHDRVWKLMSKYIRTKNADEFGMVECYTCGKMYHWKELQAGHYKHDRLDFDERNLKPQCIRCNNYLSGRLDVYTENLIRDYGIDWWKQLVFDANNHKGYSLEEMLEIEKDLKEKLSKINL